MRIDTTDGSMDNNILAALGRCLERMLSPAVFLSLLIAVVGLAYRVYKQNFSKALYKTSIPAFYVVGALCGVFSMLAAPYFPKRAMLIPCTLAIIVILRSFMQFWRKMKYLIRRQQFMPGFVLTTLIFAICTAYSIATTTPLFVKNFHNWRILSQVIQDAHRNNISELVVYESPSPTNRHVMFHSIKASPQHWINRAAARYYNLHSISIIKRDGQVSNGNR